VTIVEPQNVKRRPIPLAFKGNSKSPFLIGVTGTLFASRRESTPISWVTITVECCHGQHQLADVGSQAFGLTRIVYFGRESRGPKACLPKAAHRGICC
jgi:hypothetical protein